MKSRRRLADDRLLPLHPRQSELQGVDAAHPTQIPGVVSIVHASKVKTADVSQGNCIVPREDGHCGGREEGGDRRFWGFVLLTSLDLGCHGLLPAVLQVDEAADAILPLLARSVVVRAAHRLLCVLTKRLTKADPLLSPALEDEVARRRFCSAKANACHG